MIEIYTDIWDHYNKPNTTVLFTYATQLKKNGLAYMARGTSCQAKHRIAGIEKRLGRAISLNGPLIQAIYPNLWAFPTKQRWFGEARLNMIMINILQLTGLAANSPTIRFYFPRPGCGHGGLDYRASGIRTALMVLPDNVFVCCKREKE